MKYKYVYTHYVIFLAFECFELGRIAYTNRDFYHTLRWMQEAYNQATIEEVNNNITMNKLEILDYLSYSTYQVNLLS